MAAPTSNPSRIVSLIPAATEMVCGMGLGDRLVGVSHECNWPPEVARLPRVTRSNVDSAAPAGEIDSQVRRLLASGRPLYEVDAEALVRLQPDLIIAQSQCAVCAVSDRDVRRVVQQEPSLAGAAVLALHPSGLDEILEDVRRIGAAAGAAALARRYFSRLRDRADKVRQATDPRLGVRRPRVALVEWVEPLMIAGNWVPEMVRRAGGEYGLAAPASDSPQVAWTELTAYAPELLVVAPCGFDLSRSLAEARSLARLPGWRDLPAVRRRQAYAVDGDAYFNRPGPRQVEALEALAWAIQTVASGEGAAPGGAGAADLPAGWRRLEPVAATGRSG